MTRVPLVLLWLTAACAPAVPVKAPAEPSGVVVAGSRAIAALDYPRSEGGGQAGEPAVCTPGLALVPIGGGVRVAGMDAWLIPPGALPITGAGCDDEQRVYLLLEGRTLVRLPDGVAGKRVQILATLPAGSYQLATRGDGTSWIWGEDGQHRFHLYRHARRLHEVWSGVQRIRAVAPAGPHAVVMAAGNDVMMLRAHAEPTLLTQLAYIDGLAVGPQGELYVSTRDGVLTLTRRGAKLDAAWLTRGIHGPLRLRLRTLYVLWREQSTVVRLAERPASAH